jgi:hypothetical protein
MDELWLPSLLSLGGAAVVAFGSVLVYLESMLRIRG